MNLEEIYDMGYAIPLHSINNVPIFRFRGKIFSLSKDEKEKRIRLEGLNFDVIKYPPENKL